MRLNRPLSLIAIAASLSCAGNVCATTLYQTFTLPPLDTWQSYSMPLLGTLPGVASQWRVAVTDADIGSPLGALATDAQMQAVLGQLGALEIGGVLTNGHLGNTQWPGGFRLDNPNLAGLASDNFNAHPAVWTVTVNRLPAFGLGWVSFGGNPGAYISAQEGLDTTALLTFSAPVAYLGNQSAAHGNALTFDFWTMSNNSNPAAPPVYDYGVAILTSVPEPATGLLLLAGIATAVGRKRTFA
jgi:hypothetical protein